MKVGLTLGKFAPLHRGHQYMIERALAHVDKLYVLIYEANETWIPLTKRANWIRALYPHVIVIEGRGAPQSYGYTTEIIAEQDAYIKSMMPERITHFFSSEPYGEHVAAALNALDIRVDSHRSAYPISATLVRANPDQAYRYLDRVVINDFIKRVAILGAESTGKTTLTKALAAQYQTTYMLEHGRDYWIKHQMGGQLSPDQLVELAREHRALEDQAFAGSTGLFFTDTNAITTAQFCRLYHGDVPQALAQMARDDLHRYDLILVCGTDIPFEQDGTRQSEDRRAAMHDELMSTLRGIQYHVVKGAVDQRVAQVRNLIEN